ncbi:MAG: Fe-S cluster assembly protein SufD [Anaerolineales bacterium]|nr:Fe-S cluster assembly protein SufD [Anaerolineales bacterium]
MPTVKDEPWRRTDIRSLDVEKLRLPGGDDLGGLAAAPDYLLKPLVGNQPAGQLLLHPGGVEHCLDEDLVRQGVIFTDLATAERDHADILTRIMGQIVRPDEGKFAALASAMAHSGVLVYIPRGAQVEAPLHSILWGPGAESLAYFSHILVWVEDGASLTYVHEAASSSEKSGQAMHAGVVEIHVGSGANLRFVELQSWGEHVWNFSHERARVDRNGSLDWIFGALGSHLTKNFSEIDLVGEGATGRMSGFYFSDGDQHLDHDTQQNHLAPRTTSDLLFKGALKDRSRSVWQGMIYVGPSAQKTDGYQANRNLVLSPKARADSIPGLEILADDVRCTHGATVSKIDPDPVFYLLSRGIARDDAERLVVEGFFDPIMQRIPFDGVRERFQQAILDKMG